MIDTNVYLSRWPFRRLPLDETPALVAKLHEQGVEQAWAGSFDAVLSSRRGRRQSATRRGVQHARRGYAAPVR